MLPVRSTAPSGHHRLRDLVYTMDTCAFIADTAGFSGRLCPKRAFSENIKSDNAFPEPGGPTPRCTADRHSDRFYVLFKSNWNVPYTSPIVLFSLDITSLCCVCDRYRTVFCSILCRRYRSVCCSVDVWLSSVTRTFLTDKRTDRQTDEQTYERHIRLCTRSAIPYAGQLRRNRATV